MEEPGSALTDANGLIPGGSSTDDVATGNGDRDTGNGNTAGGAGKTGDTRPASNLASGDQPEIGTGGNAGGHFGGHFEGQVHDDQLNGNEFNDASTGIGPRADSGQQAGNIQRRRRRRYPLQRGRWRPRARQNAGVNQDGLNSDPTDDSDGEIYYIQYYLSTSIPWH